MNKLEKFLTLQCNQYQESVTTLSKYYIIGNCKIRLSDHFTSVTDADLTIIVPLNKSSKYIVTTNEGNTCYLWNSKEIIDFIPHLVTFCNLKERKIISNNPDIKDLKLIKIKSKYLGKKNPQYIGKVIAHPGNDFWDEEQISILPLLISDELKGLKVEFTNQFKDFLKTHCCSYAKVLNLYKCLYIDNSVDVTLELMIKILNQL